jgi:hypothetical protein
MAWIAKSRGRYTKSQYYRVVENHCELRLNHNQIAIVDTGDMEEVLKYRWYLLTRSSGRGFYVYTKQANKTIYLHRLVAKPNEGFEVDHINRNTMDNRRENLDATSTRKKQMNNRGNRHDNNTGVNGVQHHPSMKRYVVRWREDDSKKEKAFGYGPRNDNDQLSALAEAMVFRTLKDLENDCSNGTSPK